MMYNSVAVPTREGWLRIVPTFDPASGRALIGNPSFGIGDYGYGSRRRLQAQQGRYNIGSPHFRAIR